MAITDEGGQHRAQQVRERLVQLLAAEPGRVAARWCGHRVLLGCCEGSPRRSRGTRPTSYRPTPAPGPHTTIADSTAVRLNAVQHPAPERHRWVPDLECSPPASGAQLAAVVAQEISDELDRVAGAPAVRTCTSRSRPGRHGQRREGAQVRWQLRRGLRHRRPGEVRPIVDRPGHGRRAGLHRPTSGPVVGGTGPGLHRADTLDLGVVTSGEGELRLEDGSIATPRPGWCFVITGMQHAWHVLGSEPLELVAFTVGAVSTARAARRERPCAAGPCAAGPCAGRSTEDEMVLGRLGAAYDLETGSYSCTGAGDLVVPARRPRPARALSTDAVPGPGPAPALTALGGPRGPGPGRHRGRRRPSSS